VIFESLRKDLKPGSKEAAKLIVENIIAQSQAAQESRLKGEEKEKEFDLQAQQLRKIINISKGADPDLAISLKDRISQAGREDEATGAAAAFKRGEAVQQSGAGTALTDEGKAPPEKVISDVGKGLVKVESLESNVKPEPGDGQASEPLTPQEKEKIGFDPAVSRFGPSGATVEFHTPAKRADRRNIIRKELLDNKLFSDFKLMLGFSAKIESTLKDALSRPEKSKNIADQALIVMFNKMIDPGSVVRQSEFARSAAGQSAFARVAGFIERVRKGGVGITDSERKDIARISQKLLEAAGALYNKQIDIASLRAKADAVSPSKTLAGLNRFITSRRIFATPEEGEAAGLPVGTRFGVGEPGSDMEFYEVTGGR